MFNVLIHTQLTFNWGAHTVQFGGRGHCFVSLLLPCTFLSASEMFRDVSSELLCDATV